MLVKIKQEIRCGIGAEGDDSSVQFFIDSTMHDFDNSRLMMHKWKTDDIIKIKI